MAKSTKSKSAQKAQAHVTRITAGDRALKPKKPSVLQTAKEVAAQRKSTKSEKIVKKEEPKKHKKQHKNPLRAIGQYFKGSWQEIKLVRWPDRKSTWGMVGALLLFTLALFIVIILLDDGFAWLFKLIIGANK